MRRVRFFTIASSRLCDERFSVRLELYWLPIDFVQINEHDTFACTPGRTCSVRRYSRPICGPALRAQSVFGLKYPRNREVGPVRNRNARGIVVNRTCHTRARSETIRLRIPDGHTYRRRHKRNNSIRVRLRGFGRVIYAYETVRSGGGGGGKKRSRLNIVAKI